MGTDAKKPEWRALPGGVLAYGNSGFEIKISGDPKEQAYTLYDPEGRVINSLSAVNLGYLKYIAEGAAADRAQFDVPGDPSPPPK